MTAILEPLGFPGTRKLEFSKRRVALPGYVVFWGFSNSKWSHTHVAKSFTVVAGLGAEPDASPGDMRVSAMVELERVLGDGPLVRQKCEIHNEVVRSFRGVTDVPEGCPDGDRVAMLLDWTVTEDWRGAPEVFWYSEAEHIERWREYLSRALPVAVERLERSELDRSHKAARIVLAPIS